MTSTPVNNVSALKSYRNQADGAGVKAEAAVKESFGKIMGKMSDELANMQKSPVVAETRMAAEAPKQAEVQSTPKESVAKDATAESKRSEETADKTDNTLQQEEENGSVDRDVAEVDDENAEVQETVRESGGQLVKEIAEEMDVTLEEVEVAMAVLGLTAVELFDPENLKQLLLQISGNDNQLALVTDAELYTNLQNLLGTAEDMVEGLQQELGLSEEELTALVDQMVSVAKEPGEPGLDVDMATEFPKLPETDSKADLEVNSEEPEKLEGMKDYTVSVQRDGGTVQVKVSVDDASGDKTVREEVTDIQRTTVQTDGKAQDRNASEGNRGDGSAAGNGLLQQMPTVQNHVSETSELPNNSYQAAQTEEIMDQIMEYMKVNLREDVQKMELQLHPASLGTVNVQIASKEGTITAQFTAQNETVRAVIETQLIQLKEQFEEQGIKVDAVEVTVANHQYGQQPSEENEAMRQDQKKSGKSIRRLNLDELEDEDNLDEMEESERISVEMMRQNGGTVDYMA